MKDAQPPLQIVLRSVIHQLVGVGVEPGSLVQLAATETLQACEQQLLSLASEKIRLHAEVSAASAAWLDEDLSWADAEQDPEVDWRERANAREQHDTEMASMQARLEHMDQEAERLSGSLLTALKVIEQLGDRPPTMFATRAEAVDFILRKVSPTSDEDLHSDIDYDRHQHVVRRLVELGNFSRYLPKEGAARRSLTDGFDDEDFPS